jgi:transposase
VEIGRRALAAEHVAAPRTDGHLEALRLLLVTRRHYTDTRTASVNLLKATILTAPAQLREQLRGRSTAKQVTALTRGQITATDLDRAGQISLSTMTALAHDIARLTATLKTNKADLHAIVRAVCAQLLDLPGVGAVTAANALVAWSHKGRLRHEAAYAKLAGVCPLEASSGRTIRHRLNRGGDRTLNSALYTIAITRLRHHEPTRAYAARRTAEGLSKLEIIRCLKRYIARTIFRIMEAHAATA